MTEDALTISGALKEASKAALAGVSCEEAVAVLRKAGEDQNAVAIGVLTGAKIAYDEMWDTVKSLERRLGIKVE